MSFSVRITPAYAGTAYVEKVFTEAPEDHPRIRGNSPSVPSPRTPQPGSPPHTREQLKPCFHRGSINRITPAYAGTADYDIGTLAQV